MQGSMPDCFHRLFPVTFNHAVPESYNAVCKIGDVFFMGYKNYRIPAIVYVSEDIHDLVRRFRIEVTCWFISKYDRRIIDQGAGYGYALVLSSAHFIWLVMSSVSQVYF